MSIKCMTIGNRVTFACREVFCFYDNVDVDHDMLDEISNSGGFTIDKSCIPLDKRKELQRVLEVAFIKEDLTIKVYPDHIEIFTQGQNTGTIVLEQVDNFSMLKSYCSGYPIAKMFCAGTPDRSEIEKIINALL